MRNFVVGGNWKMQIPQINQSVRVAEEIAREVAKCSIEVFIAPSSYALNPVSQAIQKSNLKLAGQNICSHEKGAFTGESSILSLIEAKCEYVILGHSERRHIFGEPNALINQKVHKSLEKGIKPVLCIGETAKEREQGRTTEVIRKQLVGSLREIVEWQINRIIIAYEPVWAINNKYLNPDTEIKPATSKQAREAHKIVREWIGENFNNSIAEDIRIIYGGSMNEKNAAELLNVDEIDGGLIGGASLSAQKFLPVIKSAEKAAHKSNQLIWEGNTLKFER